MSVRGVPFPFRVGPSVGQPQRSVPAAMLGGPRRQPLERSAAELEQRAEALKQVRVRLNIPVGLLLRGLTVTVLVNPKVRWVAPSVAAALSRLPQVAVRAGVVPAQLRQRAQKVIGLLGLVQAVDEGRQRLALSRTVTATVLRRLSPKIIEAARQLLAVPDLKPELRVRLRGALLPIDSAQAKEKQQAQKRRDASKAQVEETQAELDRLRALEVLQQVISVVDAGQPVDPVLAAQALRTRRVLEKEKEAAAVKETRAAADPPKKTASSSRRTPGR